MAQKHPIIDEHGLEAAEVAWRASVEPTCKLMLRTAIRAYLAASPTPSVTEADLIAALRHQHETVGVTPALRTAYLAYLAASPDLFPDAGKMVGTYPMPATPWACKTCNAPRAADPCPKCGTALTKPAEGWEWPGLPDIDRIRQLARQVGYAIGVHGSLERDLDLIAAPWTDEAVGPLELAEHIAYGLGGKVVDFEHQDKPCGRWSCNIHTPDWTKMIDLSVMPPQHQAKPSWFAVRSASGAHIGMWRDERIARRIFTEEYPTGKLFALFEATSNE